jgi:hypothetical protein
MLFKWRVQHTSTRVNGCCLEESKYGPCSNENLLSWIKAHFLSFREEVSRYFSDITNTFFSLKLLSHLMLIKYKKFMEILMDTRIKTKFSSFSEAHFWIRSLLNYPTLAERVLKVFVPFPKTWECEVGFSNCLKIKTEYRSGLNVKEILQYALSSSRPRTKNLTAVKQAQPSH